MVRSLEWKHSGTRSTDSTLNSHSPIFLAGSQNQNQEREKSSHRRSLQYELRMNKWWQRREFQSTVACGAQHLSSQPALQTSAVYANTLVTTGKDAKTKHDVSFVQAPTDQESTTAINTVAQEGTALTLLPDAATARKSTFQQVQSARQSNTTGTTSRKGRVPEPTWMSHYDWLSLPLHHSTDPTQLYE